MMRARKDVAGLLVTTGLAALWTIAWRLGVHSALSTLVDALAKGRPFWSDSEVTSALATVAWFLGAVVILDRLRELAVSPRLVAAASARMELAPRALAGEVGTLESGKSSSATEPHERKGIELPAEQEAARTLDVGRGVSRSDPVDGHQEAERLSFPYPPTGVTEPLVASPPWPGVHLEDPEWSRALLGLLAGPPTIASRAVALTLGTKTALAHFIAERPEPWAPFEAGPEGSLLLDKRDGLLRALPDTRTVVAASRRAALVTVAEGTSERLLVDLVRCKAVALDGPPVAVGATLSDIVVELATRRWSDLDELIVVGFGSEIGGLEGVHCLSSADEARAYLLAGMAARRPFDWGRCIVVAPSLGDRTKADNALRSLVDVVLTLPDTGLVCCEPSLQALRCLWRLESHRQTAAVLLRAQSGLLEKTLLPPRGEDEASEEPSTAAPVSTISPGDVPAAADLRTESDTHHPLVQTENVLVRVLGPVEVINAVDSLDRRKRITELIVYLALHPEGATGEALSTAVWPDRRVPTQTVANRLSEARRMLGCSASGVARLRRRSGRHVVTDVETDWEQFERLSGPESSAEDLTTALALVRGRPFEGLSETGWALLEGIIATMEARISDAACRLALMELERTDPPAAERAVRRGLLAAPWDERLYRVLMTVCHAAGNRGGVDEALRSLARVLEWEGPPVEGVHPETARLYRQLMSE